MWQLQLSRPSAPYLLTWWAYLCHRSNKACYLMNAVRGHPVNVSACGIRSKCAVKSLCHPTMLAITASVL